VRRKEVGVAVRILVFVVGLWSPPPPGLWDNIVAALYAFHKQCNTTKDFFKILKS
jgi:hypothetical protein